MPDLLAGNAQAVQKVSPLTFSSMKFRQPSLGTKAAIFLPFLISCTRAHFLMAELGCLASIPLQKHTTELSYTALAALIQSPQMPE